ncbi:MAG: class II aldolase/adducin family protein [Terrimesophilobacter sp.]
MRYARRMALDRLIVGTSGNVSVRVGDRIVITPGSRDYDSLTPNDVSVVLLTGDRLAGPPPSSELPLHLAIHESMAVDGSAVVHVHSKFATVLSSLGIGLPAVHYQIAALGGPIRIADYATFGTPELAQSVVAALDGRRAALMANHGSVAVGESLAEAFRHASTLEWMCSVYYSARLIGAPNILDDAELTQVRSQQARFSQERAEWAAEGGQKSAQP